MFSWSAPYDCAISFTPGSAFYLIIYFWLLKEVYLLNGVFAVYCFVCFYSSIVCLRLIHVFCLFLRQKLIL